MHRHLANPARNLAGGGLGRISEKWSDFPEPKSVQTKFCVFICLPDISAVRRHSGRKTNIEEGVQDASRSK